MKELILGGARSGKSMLAQQRAHQSALAVTYVATAQALDAEMTARIAHHRHSRPSAWKLLEEPLSLAAVLKAEASVDRCLLIDCLTLWLSNLLAAGERRLHQEKKALLEVLPHLSGHILLVSNEVGQGIVPLDPLARRFRDEAGWLHQELAQRCERVTLVVAGLPLQLKDISGRR